jgi:hypothetical protein
MEPVTALGREIELTKYTLAVASTIMEFTELFLYDLSFF